MLYFRPPWFESGRQQDCSEFLTYLLDTLQEEERTVRPLERNAATETENLKENPTIKTEVLEDQDEDMKSFDSTRETNISEVNPNIDNGEVKETTDEVIDKGELDESFGLSSEKRLSRGSGGSVGMSRWSTEENLSGGDSTEVLSTARSTEELKTVSSTADKINTTTTTTNTCIDSHSNSTDSGIQSVESQSPEQSDPTTPLSVVQKMFGGRMETSFLCQTCNKKSMFSDWFTDLHLAIPQTSVSSNPSVRPENEKILAQQATLKQAFSDLNSFTSS